MKEYEQAITEALESRYSERKLLGLHKQFLHMNLETKLKKIDGTRTLSFENWFANFSLRSEEFFRNMYSTIDVNRVTFEGLSYEIVPPYDNIEPPKQNAPPD